jgi:hypothetical protein
MDRTMHIEIGENHALEITYVNGKRVGVWRVIERHRTGENSWHLSMLLLESKSFRLAAQEVKRVVEQFLSDTDPETQKSMVEKLSSL